ncbi:hypothetical protein HMN09_00347500 [Mycena chlorophos]|uniref:Uncharacterized protein n=1 Tax=Mycena chlorophos TaxID=658473 RepID=A0A8H6WN32_MYCCL|nr:hypothetical protein HMN09_00347500 [Mycena chlorophos]
MSGIPPDRVSVVKDIARARRRATRTRLPRCASVADQRPTRCTSTGPTSKHRAPPGCVARGRARETAAYAAAQHHSATRLVPELQPAHSAVGGGGTVIISLPMRPDAECLIQYRAVFKKHTRPVSSADDTSTSFVSRLSAKTHLRAKYLNWLRSPASRTPWPPAGNTTSRRRLRQLALGAPREAEALRAIHTGDDRSFGTQGVVVPVFSGHGRTNAVFWVCVDECKMVLQTEGFLGLLVGEGSGLEALEEAEVYQVAIFVSKSDFASAKVCIG